MDESNIIENINETPISPKQSYVMIALDSTVIFPGQLLSFDIPKGASVSATLKAIEDNGEVFIVYQNRKTETPTQKDICKVGTLAKIKQMVRLPSDGIRALALGLERMEIEDFVSVVPYFQVTLKPFVTSPEKNEYLLDAMRHSVRDALKNVMKVSPKLLDKEPNLENTNEFISEMANIFYTSCDEKQELLALPSVYGQLENIYTHLLKHCEIAALEKDIEVKVRKNIDKNQHDYFLREKIKAIHEELGEDENEIEEYRDKIEKKNLPEYAKVKAEKELSKLSKMAMTSPESAVSRGFLDLVLELPWNNYSDEAFDLTQARKILDEDHFGLKKVKERVIEYLAVQTLKKDMKAPILCFVGPPGVGKTSIVASIARAANRKFVTMSLGGVRDEAEIRGHRRTYIGSLPGRIISGLRDAEVGNPVFLLDEIDKMSADFRGDPSSALLEVLDSKQNDHFKDHFLEMPYDLSKVMFITTANSLETIDPPLLDRMEVIELTGYTYEEKLQIAKRYLLPKQCEANGVDKSNISIIDDAIINIIQRYTRESGVRTLEREIASVIRKAAVKIVETNDKSKKFKITVKNLEEYLGKEKYTEDFTNGKDEVGIATGLAWTSVGGTTLSVEVAIVPKGKGDIRLTGNLGDVMKESAQTALSLVKVEAISLGIDPKVFAENDVHIHFPEGATPKDGPSAGITIATAIASAFSGKGVAGDVAMTGEVTLRGKVLPIGGLKEKSLAALRFGKKRLIIPKDNAKDLDEIPDEVKSGMQIIMVETINQVFAEALR